MTGIPEDDERYHMIQCISNIPFRNTFENIVVDNNEITWEALFKNKNIILTEYENSTNPSHWPEDDTDPM